MARLGKAWEKFVASQQTGSADRVPVARRKRQRRDCPASAIDPPRPVPAIQIIDVEPMGKPTLTSSDRWRKRPAVLRWRAYADLLRLHRPTLPDRFVALFCFTMPSSWSTTKQAKHLGQPKTTKPDYDNCLKALADALNAHDETIHDGRAIKRFGAHGRVVIFDPNQIEVSEALIQQHVPRGGGRVA